MLWNIIHELHQRYLGSIPLVTADVLTNLLLHAQQEKYNAIEYANKQLNTDHIVEELQVKDVRSNERLQVSNFIHFIGNVQFNYIDVSHFINRYLKNLD